MTTRPFAEVRDRFGEIYDAVVAEHEPVLVDREGQKGVVILPADEYESLVETAHLLSWPTNAARLLDALASARAGSTPPMTVEELAARAEVTEVPTGQPRPNPLLGIIGLGKAGRADGAENHDRYLYGKE